MFLKNYTSNVPVSDTIYRIEQVLIRCQVKGIEKEYGEKMEIRAITFRIELEQGRPMLVRLPVDTGHALDALFKDYAGSDPVSRDGNTVVSSYKKKTREDFRQQAERTAWKIVQDWVEVQMSMIQMKQADFREVFLPYFWDGKRTFFQAVRDTGFKGLLAENNNHP